MFVVMRDISGYTGPDVLLGVFAAFEEADKARAYYIEVREAYPEADPWRDQGYKSDMKLSEDVVINELPGKFVTGQEVFVVSNYFEGFGQDRRVLDSIYDSRADAEGRVDVLDRTEDNWFPHYALIDTVVVGTLYSDSPDEQPQPDW